MGLSSYTWEPTVGRFNITTKVGKQQTFSIVDRHLVIYSTIRPPASNDTLAWLKLSLEEASAYLNTEEYRVLDSCIQVKSYGFLSDVKPLYVSLDLTPWGGTTSLQGEYYNYYVGNFCITLDLYGIRNLAAELQP